MNHKISWLAIVLLLGTIGGCTDPLHYRSASPPAVVPSTLPDANQLEPLTLEAADAMMAAVIEAINQQQAEELVPYLLERDQDIEQVRAAIADYNTYFQGEPIQGFERLDRSMPQRSTYRLYSSSGISKTLDIYQDRSIRLVDEFFLYSRWVKLLVAQLVEAIHANDAEHLARILNSDDLPYPIEGAEQAISAYREAFDLGTTDRGTIRFTFMTLDPETNSFIYRLSTTRQGQPVEHTVAVVYGDGLVSLKDELIPDRDALGVGRID